jgi:selenocysteine-specific elongation factor
LGTAGHIDHGKTALVRALTGIDTDRLKEEKERGITIELGFAHLDGEGLQVSIVDVPGHERFVRAMTAGAVGMDAVMLVVAADEGVMPQTREHLAICNLLGMTTGFVALTKIDLADEEWLELVKDDLAGFLEGTFLENSPVIECSAQTGKNVEGVRDAILAMAEQVEARSSAGLTRMPLDRVFTMKGFGTVVTGTLVSGSLATGDEIISLPSRARAKVRGIQVHGESKESVDAGQRVAVNLKGVDKGALSRGEVLVAGETLQPTRRFDAIVTHLGWNRSPLKRRKPSQLLVGTTQHEAISVPLASNELGPGETGPVQIQTKHPVVVFPGDRFIMQGYELNPQHGATTGGGIVIRPHPPRKRKPDPAYAELLGKLVEASPERRIELEVEAAGLKGVEERWLVTQVPYEPGTTRRLLDDLFAKGALVCFDRERKGAVHPDLLESLEQLISDVLASLADESPMLNTFPSQEVYSKLPGNVDPKLFRLAVSQLVDTGELVEQRENVGLAESPHAERREELSNRIASLLREGGLTPPRPPEIASELAVSEDDVRDVITQLVRDGRVVRAPEDLWFHAEVVDELKSKLVAHLQRHGQITPLEFKEMCGVTRKYMIPLAEMFDDQQVTIRTGDVRKLRNP